MNTNPQFQKPCYRCDNVVRMTPEQFRADDNAHTICPVCRDKLEIEADFAGTPLPRKHRHRPGWAAMGTPLRAAARPGFVPSSASSGANTGKKLSPKKSPTD